jgi:hypothetical protein
MFMPSVALVWNHAIVHTAVFAVASVCFHVEGRLVFIATDKGNMRTIRTYKLEDEVLYLIDTFTFDL